MDERTSTGHELDEPIGPTTAVHQGLPSEACLVEIYGLSPGARHDLRGEVVALGRGEENAIVLELDSVSRVHARVNNTRGRFTIEDLLSTNGTYVNGRVIEDEVTLGHGDTIKIGGALFRFLTGERMEADYRQEIYRLHIIDGLTGLHNRRYFRELVEREVARGLHYGRALALVFFALDDYDGLLDDFGRIAVEHVMAQLCAEVSRGLRPEELAARLGENQFALLLPERDVAGGRAAAERLVALAAGQQATFEGEPVPLSVSAGVVALAPQDSAEGLLRRGGRTLNTALGAGPGALQVAE